MKQKTYKKIIHKYEDKINKLYEKQILTYKKRIKVSELIIISAIGFVILFNISYRITKIFSAAVIVSIPMIFLPYIIICYILDKEKKQILCILPSYIMNLRHYIEQQNNIIEAINNVECEEPLKKYIEQFKMYIVKGMSIKEAFRILKTNINVRKFSECFTIIETCYLNGGNLKKILNKYVEIISKENIQREKTKEKAYSSVIILGVMIVINIYLVFAFVLTNAEYANIIRNTFVGRIIFNINVISYIFVGYVILKIYKTGEKI